MFVYQRVMDINGSTVTSQSGERKIPNISKKQNASPAIN